MRRIYIEKTQPHQPTGYAANRQFRAKRTISCSALLHIAESVTQPEKLFLFGSAASGLAVTLTDMDRKSGGECG